MPLWTRPVSLTTLDAIGVNSASEFFGIRYTAFGNDWIEATIPLDERTRNANGTLHPGALGMLAETIGSVAASLCIDTSHQSALAKYFTSIIPCRSPQARYSPGHHPF
jgi:1,4-dihydroxy-2-naphthoyl-CoA hydrolase